MKPSLLLTSPTLQVSPNLEVAIYKTYLLEEPALGPLHTRDWEPVTGTLQALSLVENAEPVQVRFFTLCLRDQRSMWMQDGRKRLHGLLHGIEWIMLHGHLDSFQKPFLGGRPNTKSLGDHGTPNADNSWFMLFYHVWEPAWITIHWNSIWLRAKQGA